MKKMKFLTAYNGEQNKGADYTNIKSQATPDSAYSLRDLITQFASGVREFEEIVGNYDEHPNFDEVSPLNNPKFGLEDWTIEQLDVAKQHTEALIRQREKEAHLKAMQEQEKAREEAIAKAKAEAES